MGQPISFPVLISPTGVQAVHPEGEVAVARAAAARGTAMSLSSFASRPIEDVAAANPQTFFQLYWVGTRDQMLARMRASEGRRRRRAHRDARLVLLARPRLGQPHDPRDGGPAHDAALRTRGTAASALALVLREDRPAAGPHGPEPGRARASRRPTFFGAYGEWMQTPPPTWEDVAWLRRSGAGRSC